ncbi:MAG TPA: hypothetical protein PKM44_01790 [Turneriella sp.]|nr:hypothetical protein [Turneriella sp.]HNE18655.1 hypothetical protein [Turneriella sp.]HNJ65399.1 hypothetical protein [Turneriella sp.]HNL09214.1 hypothetical protein [Turneriella sp.]HNL54708.1 hypothetical protein [Turneriella sp.]
MKKLILISALASLLVAAVSAGPIRDDYFKTRDDLEKSKDTPESRKQFLETNIQRSLRRLLVRYYGYPTPEKVKISASNYEQSEKDKLTYYFKFEEYIGFLTFSNDPEYYYAVPREEKILQKQKAEGK